MNKLTHQEQLRIIEGICLLWENGDKADINQAQKMIDDIYKISHINGTCGNLHEDWQEEAINLGEKLKEWGITDYKETRSAVDIMKEKGVTFSEGSGLPKIEEKIDGKTEEKAS